MLWRAHTFRHIVHLMPGQTILDLGCGEGTFTRQLARVFRGENPITAVTFVPDAARPADRPPQVSFLTASSLPGPLQDRQFDFVIAPWNLANYTISTNAHRVFVDERPLIVFHFHRLKQIEARVYDPRLTDYKIKASKVVRRSIYAPYIRTLAETAQHMPPLPAGGSASDQHRDPVVEVDFRGKVARKFNQRLRLLQGILEQDYFVVTNGRVF